MTHFRPLLFIIVALLVILPRPVDANPQQPHAFGQLPLSFIPNRGQSQSTARYLVRSLGGELTFTINQVKLSLPAGNLSLSFDGANPSPTLTALDELPGKVNYFIGSDTADWHTNIPTYEGITYTELYPGVDLSYDGSEGLLKGTFTVAPNADPSIIRWRYAGAESISFDAITGDLQIALPGGSVLAERAPTAWQTINGQDVPVSIAYDLAPDDSIGFTLGSYNPSYPLILDPTLVYSTYLGGSAGDNAQDIAIDPSGNVYVVGGTGSTNFPTATPFQPAKQADSDAFIAKLNPSGTALIYSTYLGGNGWDEAYSVTVDTSGNAYITGRTLSSNFPTASAYQNTNSGAEDVFIAKFNPSGSALIYSTYLGGTGSEHSTGIAITASGSAYIAGVTNSTNFPTLNPHQNTYGGGQWDAFVTRLNPAGSALTFSTYLGGTFVDISMDIALDSAGNAYVTGGTISDNFPTLNPYQAAHGGFCPGGEFAPDCEDAYLSKFSPNGSLLYSTYLGGSDFDQGNSVALDAAGNIYLVGDTYSTNFPTLNAYQETRPSSNGAAFITKLNWDGASLLFSTYFGGTTGGGTAQDIAVDSIGNIYITGITLADDFPVVMSIQATKAGDPTLGDVFVSHFNPSGSALMFSTYLGGVEDEYFEFSPDIALGANGNIYVSGTTFSEDFPVVNAFQAAPGGVDNEFFDHYDAFIFRIAPEILTVTSTADTDDGNCDSHCTLREAINASNSTPNQQTIAFNIPGAGVKTIQPTSMLPTISDPVIINGTSQTGFNGVPIIEIDGSQAGPIANGFYLTTGGSVIRGLIINNFVGAGIVLQGVGSNQIVGNYIGTDSTGTQAHGNRDGIYILGTPENVIGGTTPVDRNVISGNHDDGINFEGPNTINNQVRGNFIGTAADGISPLGNAGDGIKISYASSGVFIGSATTTNAGNVIAFNNLRGVYGELDGGSAGVSNRILGNFIFGNVGIGIDLNGDGITPNDTGDGDTGANNLQNYPVLTEVLSSAGVTAISGTFNSLPNTTFRLEFFANPTCDSSGYGEGQIYLGFASLTTDGDGNQSFMVGLNVNVPVGQFITATASANSSSTSEFSACIPVTAGSTAGTAPNRNYYTTLQPTLTWTRVNWASGYHVEIDNNQNFMSPEFADDTAADQLSIEAALPQDGSYYWRVCAKNATNSCAAWSIFDAFTINAP
ncbi:MAG: SBBP repeat-containing protein [Anaerolineae bacterium]|nr:SBBP repeat-containing protein [Anaerolineae bacterium]